MNKANVEIRRAAKRAGISLGEIAKAKTVTRQNLQDGSEMDFRQT